MELFFLLTSLGYLLAIPLALVVGVIVLVISAIVAFIRFIADHSV